MEPVVEEAPVAEETRVEPEPVAAPVVEAVSVAALEQAKEEGRVEMQEMARKTMEKRGSSDGCAVSGGTACLRGWLSSAVM